MWALQLVTWIGGAVLTTIGLGFYSHVHSERWKVKTLADSFLADTNCIITTITEQRHLHPPEVSESVMRLHGEHTTYRLTGRLIEAGIETDGDYHLVLEEPKTADRY